MRLYEFREYVKDIVSETISEIITEKKKKKSKKSKKGKKSDQTRDAYISASLDSNDDDKFSHADLAYELWPDLDKDSARSYFSKCVKGKRHFSDEDATTLYSLLRKS